MQTDIARQDDHRYAPLADRSLDGDLQSARHRFTGLGGQSIYEPKMRPVTFATLITSGGASIEETKPLTVMAIAPT
jgi:hypothetical protein